MTSSRRARRRATRALLGAYIWDHIGRAIGLGVGVLTIALLIFLAAIGYDPALGFLVVVALGVAIIAIGGRMRGGR
jgi:hypothetical protein